MTDSTHSQPAPNRILRLPEVLVRIGRGRTSLYRDIKAGRFPRPVKIGPRSRGWFESDVEDLQAAQRAEREQA